jgi:uncharacterized protein (TIGR02266 family)
MEWGERMSEKIFDSDKKSKDDVVFSNRRRNSRLDWEMDVDFEVSIDGPHTFFSGFTQDISTGGVFLATHQIYPIGTEMKVSLVVEGEKIELNAVVKWVRKQESISSSDLSPGMGLQFVAPDDKYVEIIEQFVKKKEPLLVDLD